MAVSVLVRRQRRAPGAHDTRAPGSDTLPLLPTRARTTLGTTIARALRAMVEAPPPAEESPEPAAPPPVVPGAPPVPEDDGGITAPAGRCRSSVFCPGVSVTRAAEARLACAS